MTGVEKHFLCASTNIPAPDILQLNAFWVLSWVRLRACECTHRYFGPAASLAGPLCLSGQLACPAPIAEAAIGSNRFYKLYACTATLSCGPVTDDTPKAC